MELPSIEIDDPAQNLSTHKAQPETLPENTYWPFFLAIGLMFIFWGLLTTWVIGVAGGIVFFISLLGWINILKNE